MSKPVKNIMEALNSYGTPKLVKGFINLEDFVGDMPEISNSRPFYYNGIRYNNIVRPVLTSVSASTDNFINVDWSQLNQEQGK